MHAELRQIPERFKSDRFELIKDVLDRHTPTHTRARALKHGARTHVPART